MIVPREEGMKTVVHIRVTTLVAAAALIVSLAAVVVAQFAARAQAPTGPRVQFQAQTQVGAEDPMGGQDAKACVRSRHQLERNKRNAVAFYTVAFNDKNPRRAVELYGGDEYIQHNPLAANGFDAFISFVESFTAAFPDAHIDIRRVFADCDFVITHALATGAVPVYTQLGTKLVDIFRLDRNGKIVEHWDVGAAISATSANGNPEV
jgi:predicted SnoaL-like aldol condensation-catalyzing enzyme